MPKLKQFSEELRILNHPDLSEEIIRLEKKEQIIAEIRNAKSLWNAFNKYLDDTYGTVEIGEYDYPSSKAMRLTDSKVYQIEFNAYIRTLLKDEKLSDSKIKKFAIQIIKILNEEENVIKAILNK